MSLSSEMDAFKDIPGYKAILKSVLKSQIQLLIEQLADQTGEESIILTASINDGTLSHLGSSTGKGFLEGRDEMKSQFLGYCLKTHHRKKTQETKSPPYQRSNQRHTPYRTPSKQSRVHPVSLQKARSVDNSAAVMHDPNIPAIDPNNAGGQIKQEEEEQLNRETSDFSSTPKSFPSSLQLSHTQTSADLDTSGQDNIEGQGQVVENAPVDSDETSNSATNIKIEPITENDMELEITGVEPGNTSLTQEDWGQGSMVYGSAGADGDSSVNQSVETSNYRIQLSDMDGWYSDSSEIQGEEEAEQDEPQSQELCTRKPARHFERKTCGICGRGVLSSNFNRHMLRHNEVKWKCEICSRLFSTEALLKKHQMNMKHESAENFHMCNYCGKHFKRKSAVIEHIRVIHEGSARKPFTCTVCGKMFTRPGHLTNHMNMHFGQKPHVCKCGRRYASKASLHLHESHCKGDGKNECKICSRQFSSSLILEEHIESKHNGKRFVCACGMKFNWRTNLHKHKKSCDVKNNLE